MRGIFDSERCFIRGLRGPFAHSPVVIAQSPAQFRAQPQSFTALFIAGVIFLLTSSRPVHAVSVTALGAVSLPGGSVTSTSGFNYPYHSTTYGFGLTFGFRMFPQSMIQFGFLYLSRGFAIDAPGAPAIYNYTLTSVQLPITVHYYMMPSLAIGFGGYYSYAIGNITVTPQGGTDIAGTIPFSPKTYGAGDSGIIASMTLKIALLPIMSLIADARYLYGLQNISQNDSASIFLRDFQVLGGIRFGR